MAAERIWVTVQASKDHPQVLAVQDAMQQVLDIFELIAPSNSDVIWNLFVANRTNPFTAGAEAVSLSPEVNISKIARRQKALLASRIRSLSRGRMPRYMTKAESGIAQRLLQRNTNGISKTEIRFEERSPAAIVIDEKRAQVGLRAIKPRVLPHIEVGSIEGRILSAEFHYGNPAIRIRDRRSGDDVICVVSDSLKEQIEKDLNFSVVWHKRRVMVRGRIRYKADGSIEKVEANDVEIIAPRPGLTVDDLYDDDFTDGLDTATYLEKLREGELGR